MGWFNKKNKEKLAQRERENDMLDYFIGRCNGLERWVERLGRNLDASLTKSDYLYSRTALRIRELENKLSEIVPKCDTCVNKFQIPSRSLITFGEK